MNCKRISGTILNIFGLLSTLMLSVNVEAQAPRKAQIVFASSQNGKYDIYVMNTNGEQQLNLTKNPLVNNIEPTWSPDGKKIAFSSTRDGIYVMHANGRNIRRLTDQPGSSPAWSPDGKKIAFSSTQDGNGNIYVMSTDGNNIHQLTNHPASDSNPAWSPNGRKIAFRSDRDGNWEIYVMNADGTEQVQLTNTDSLPNDFPVYNRNPFWSPNSRKIGFDSNRNGNYEIYLMDANGDNPTNLTQNPASDIGGSWVLGELAVSPKTSLLTLWGKIKVLEGEEK